MGVRPAEMYGTFTFAGHTTAQPHTGPNRRVGRSVIVGCAGLLIMAVTCMCCGVTESTWAGNVPEFTSLVHVIDVTKRLNEVQKTDKSLDSVLSMWRMNHMLSKLRQTKGAKSSLVAQRTSDWKDKARAALKMIAIKRADAVALKVRPKLQAYCIPFPRHSLHVRTMCFAEGRGNGKAEGDDADCRCAHGDGQDQTGRSKRRETSIVGQSGSRPCGLFTSQLHL